METRGKTAVAGELRAIPRTMPDCSPGFDALALGVGHGVDIGAHHPDLIVFFIQVVQQNVPQLDDSDQLPLMTDWQVPESVPSHQRHAASEVFCEADRHGIIGHHLSHASGTAIAPLGDNPVPFGKDPDEFAIVNDRNRPDVSLYHGANGLKDRISQICLIGLLVLDQIADTHSTPPGLEKSDRSQVSIGAGVYA